MNDSEHKKLMNGKSVNPSVSSTMVTYNVSLWSMLEKVEKFVGIFKKKRDGKL